MFSRRPGRSGAELLPEPGQVVSERLDTLASTVSATAAALAKTDGELAILRRSLESGLAHVETVAGEMRSRAGGDDVRALEARATELSAVCSGRDEVETAVDRVVWYAGWADKLTQVLGSANPVAGPYFNFTVPEPTGVVAIVAPAGPPLDGLVSRLAPALVGGNAVVALASETHPLAAIELAEAIATSDLPGGVVNILTGLRDELAPVLAAHMDVNAIDVTGADGAAAELERAAAENVKRVVRQAEDRSPWEIAAFLELKTIWHPIGL